VLKVGLTGGIASGKTAVGEMFARRGVHVIQADAIAHQLMEPGSPVYDQVVRHFGKEILDADGQINRRKLAEVVFGKPNGHSTANDRSRQPSSRVNELNKLVHPAVIQRQEEWMEEIGRREPHDIAMVDAALIFEAGAAKRFDKVIVVTCDPEQRAERLAARLRVDPETAQREVVRRLAAQIPDEEKVRMADYVIRNSGSLSDTEQQVHEVLEKLREDEEETPLPSL